MKSADKLAAAQRLVERERERKSRTATRRATRETVKALRLMAEMLEAGEIVEWSIDHNYGFNLVERGWPGPGIMEQVLNGRDTLTISFHHSLAKFAKRLRRRKSRKGSG